MHQNKELGGELENSVPKPEQLPYSTQKRWFVLGLEPRHKREELS